LQKKSIYAFMSCKWMKMLISSHSNIKKLINSLVKKFNDNSVKITAVTKLCAGELKRMFNWTTFRVYYLHKFLYTSRLQWFTAKVYITLYTTQTTREYTWQQYLYTVPVKND